MRSSRFLALMLISISIATVGLAQKKNRQTVSRTRNPAAVNPTNKYASTPFNPELTLLPSRFKGHDADLIFHALRLQDIEAGKDEFETTAKWEKRKEAIYGKPLVGTVDDRSIFAFVIPIKTKYNADEQRMYYNMEMGGDGMLWRSETFHYQPYLGSNAFGVTRRVQPVLYSQTIIIATNHIPFGSFSIKRADAIESKYRLNALVVCRLVEPYWQRENDTLVKPTIQEPVEVKVVRSSLHVKVLEIWFFDFLTGTIYAKEKVDGK